MNRKINQYAVYLSTFARNNTESLESVLQAIGRSALHADNRITKIAEAPHDSEYLAEVVTENSIIVNDLLGCAFVATQTYITCIVSRTKEFHQRVKHHGYELKTTNATKPAIMQSFSNRVPHTSFSEIQMINAFANYFKHHDEWPHNWDATTNKSKETVSIIQSVGAAKSSRDNCRKGLTALGIDSVSDVYELVGIVCRWHSNLKKAYGNEIKSLSQS